MGAAQKVALEQTTRAAVLHNVIIGAEELSFGRQGINSAYNATLCNTALEKKLPAQVTQCTHYCINNCDGNFFRSVGKEWQLKWEYLF